jgi:hypothetical protein
MDSTSEVIVAGPGPSYFTRHWWGELSLPISYWLNGCLASLVIFVVLTLATKFGLGGGTVLAATVLSFAWLFFVTVVTWHAVGVWRSAGKHASRGGSHGWAILARVCVPINMLYATGVVAVLGVPQVYEDWRVALRAQAAAEALDKQVLSDPTIAALHAAAPELYEDIRNTWLDNVSRGTSSAEAAAMTRGQIAHAVRKYLPLASNEAVIEFTRVQVIEIDQIGAKNVDACVSFLSPRPGDPPLDVSKYVTADTIERHSAASVAVITSGATNPQPVPVEVEIQKNLSLVAERLVARYGEADVAVIGDMHSPTADHGKICMIFSAVYKEVLALPVQDQVSLLRYFYSIS